MGSRSAVFLIILLVVSAALAHAVTPQPNSRQARAAKLADLFVLVQLESPRDPVIQEASLAVNPLLLPQLAEPIDAGQAAQLLEQGKASFHAGQYEQAVKQLEAAADGLLNPDSAAKYLDSGVYDTLPQFEQAQMYLALAYHRLGLSEQTQRAVLRLFAAERVQPVYTSVGVNPEIRSEFQSVASVILPGLTLPPVLIAEQPSPVTPPAVQAPLSSEQRAALSQPRLAPQVPAPPEPPQVTAAAAVAPAPQVVRQEVPPTSSEVAGRTVTLRTAREIEAEREGQQRAIDQQVVAARTEAERQASERMKRLEQSLRAEIERVATERAAAARSQCQAEAEQRIAAARESARREAEQRLVAEREAAKRDAEEQIAAARREVEERIAAERAAAERTIAERVAAERAAAEQAVQQRLAAEREAARRAGEERAAAQRAAAERAAAERAAAERAAAEREQAIRTAEETSIVRRAEALVSGGHFGEAERLYVELLDRPQLTRRALIDVATGLYRVASFQEATRAFERLGTLQSGEEDLHYYRAVVLYETGRYQQAKRELERALPHVQITNEVARYQAKIEGAASQGR